MDRRVRSLPPLIPFCQVVCKDRDVRRRGGDSAWEVRELVKGARPLGEGFDGVYRFLSRARFARIETERGFRLPYLAPFLGLVRSRNRNREPSRSFLVVAPRDASEIMLPRGLDER